MRFSAQRWIATGVSHSAFSSLFFRTLLGGALAGVTLLALAGCSIQDARADDGEPVGPSRLAQSSSDTVVKTVAPLAGATDEKKPKAMLLSAPPAAKTDSKAKPKFVPLGKPKTGTVIAKPDRALQTKRLIDNYEKLAIRYVDDLARANTDDAKEALSRRQPSFRTARTFVKAHAAIVKENPADEPALDSLVFISRFVGIPAIDEVLSDADVDPMSALLEHHANDEKIVTACQRLPRGDNTDAFLQKVFDQTLNPNVRWSSGAQLISSLRRNKRPKQMEQVVLAMSEDRYLEGVEVGGKAGGNNARKWASDKLREIRTLGVGNPFPAVGGKKLDGTEGHISDYQGKVVVVDIWTTWCGPCKKMIPHTIEMAEHLKDKPFTFLSVSCDRDEETLKEFLEENSMPWEHWWVGKESEFTETLNISAFPTIYVLDSKGVIRHKGLRDKALETAVNELLAEMSSSDKSNPAKE